MADESVTAETTEDERDQEVQRIVTTALTDAAQYVEEELSPERARALSYYKAEPFGDEEEGRSQVISTDVRDSIASVMPSILRVIFGPDRVVEYIPKSQEDAEDAKQQTDYIFHVLETQGGFLKLHAAIKDGLIGGLGAIKWWWEEGESRTQRLKNLSAEQVLLLQNDASVELKNVEPQYPRRRLTTKIKQMVGVEPMDVPLFNVELVRHDKEGHLAFEAVPPEELIFSRQARGVDRTSVIAHRTEKTKSDLLALGYSEEDIEAAGGSDLWANEEEVARRNDSMGEDPDLGEHNRKTLYCEAYIPIDGELTKFCTLGPTYQIVHQEPADSVDFAVWTPDPIPHVLQGESWSVRTMDVQSINSHLLRAIFDSAGNAVFPRPIVEEGMASMADVLNNEIGAPIRVRKQGAVVPYENRFIGADLVPLLGVMHDLVERRTGRNKAAAGLDADALQSTTKSAADAAIQGSGEQVELLVRMVCEQLLKPMFRGFRRLTVKHQPRMQMVRLRGKWVEIDPRTWDSDADVSVNVALGSTLSHQRAMNIGVLLQKQEQILTMLGLNQPIVTPQQYAETLRRLTLALGEREVDAYFSQVPPDWKPEPPPQQQDPATALAMAQLEVEKIKTMRELEISERELALKEKQHGEEQAVEIAIKAAELALERFKINAEHQADIENRELEKSALAVDSFIEAERLDLEEKSLGVDAALQADKLEKDAEIAKTKAAQKPKPKAE